MNNYVIFTDSACDIKPELLKRWGVECIDLSFRFDGDDREYFNSDMDIREFYRAMREGSVAKTSAINPDRFLSTFEAVMKQDKDILYLGFSSGLSTTCNSARMAAEELKERYPARKLLIVDTLAAKYCSRIGYRPSVLAAHFCSALGLILMGQAMLSKSLIQFSVD